MALEHAHGAARSGRAAPAPAPSTPRAPTPRPAPAPPAPDATDVHPETFYVYLALSLIVLGVLLGWQVEL